MQKLGSIISRVVTPILVLLIGGVVAHDHLAPRPLSTALAPAVDAKALGRSFVPEAASCLGDGWLAAADALERGQTVPEAQAALQAAWLSSRSRAFNAKLAPEFSRVLPEGAEPVDPARRAEVVRFWRDFASGLKGGR